MLRFLLILTVTWSLVAAPALCRAGILDECCEHQPAPPLSGEKATCGGAGCGCTDESPRPQPQQPEERQCSWCAGVCRTQIKPSDEGGNTLQFQHALPVAVDTPSDMGLLGRASRCFAGGAAERHRIPFPPSDVPLLI